MSARRPLAVACDVVETLFSLDPVRAALDDAGAGPRSLELFFARLLRDGFALAASGDQRPFRELAAGAGLRVVTLTNGGREQTASLLSPAGLDRHVERVLSVEEAGGWKPGPQPYQHAEGTLGVAPDRLALLSVHAWDVHGARRAGLVIGWASRLEGSFPAVFDPPDVSGPELVAVADALLALPKDVAA